MDKNSHNDLCDMAMDVDACNDLPPILGIWGELGLDEATFSCTILKKNGQSIKKTLFLIGFLLPCLVIIVSYSCIYLKVQRQRKKIKNHTSFQVSSKDEASNARKSKDDNRLTVMMVTIFICFLVCFLPLMLANVVDDERYTTYPWLHILASVMAWASSVINPFIYAASNRNYRIAYYKIFSLLKFWGEPMSPMPSKSIRQSKNSRDTSGAVRSTPFFIGVQRNKKDVQQLNRRSAASLIRPVHPLKSLNIYQHEFSDNIFQSDK